MATRRSPTPDGVDTGPEVLLEGPAARVGDLLTAAGRLGFRPAAGEDASVGGRADGADAAGLSAGDDPAAGAGPGRAGRSR